MTTLPPGARRTLSWEKNSRTCPRGGHGRSGRDCASLRFSEAVDEAGSNGEVDGAADHLAIDGGGVVARFVGRLDQIVDWVHDCVIEILVARIRIFVRDAVSRGDAVASPRVVEFLDFRQEIRRLLELNRVALAVEKALEECLFRSDQRGDAGFDALLADQVIDVDRQLLAKAVDTPDSLFEHRGIPWELDVDNAVGGALKVQTDAACVAGEQDAQVGVVVKLDDVLGARAAGLRPR